MIGELTDNFPDILKTCVLIASGDISDVKTDAAVTVHNYDNINHVVRKIILIYSKRFSTYSFLMCTCVHVRRTLHPSNIQKIDSG